jgi:hypothetical protein
MSQKTSLEYISFFQSAGEGIGDCPLNIPPENMAVSAFWDRLEMWAMIINRCSFEE